MSSSLEMGTCQREIRDVWLEGYGGWLNVKGIKGIEITYYYIDSY